LFYILGAINYIQSNNYFRIVFVLWLILFTLLSIRESDKVKNAASMQEIVDRTLFNFDIFSPKIKTIDLHKLALRLKSKNAKEYEYAVTHNGDEGGVKDWYSDVSDITHEKAILLCQIENCEWELSLRR